MDKKAQLKFVTNEIDFIFLEFGRKKARKLFRRAGWLDYY